VAARGWGIAASASRARVKTIWRKASWLPPTPPMRYCLPARACASSFSPMCVSAPDGEQRPGSGDSATHPNTLLQDQEPVSPNTLPRQGVKSGLRAFLIVRHNEYGLLILEACKKRKGGRHYQLPGGCVSVPASAPAPASASASVSACLCLRVCVFVSVPASFCLCLSDSPSCLSVCLSVPFPCLPGMWTRTNWSTMGRSRAAVLQPHASCTRKPGWTSVTGCIGDGEGRGREGGGAVRSQAGPGLDHGVQQLQQQQHLHEPAPGLEAILTPITALFSPPPLPPSLPPSLYLSLPLPPPSTGYHQLA
jgi:hypothetical protein